MADNNEEADTCIGNRIPLQQADMLCNIDMSNAYRGHNSAVICIEEA